MHVWSVFFYKSKLSDTAQFQMEWEDIVYLLFKRPYLATRGLFFLRFHCCTSSSRWRGNILSFWSYAFETGGRYFHLDLLFIQATIWAITFYQIYVSYMWNGQTYIQGRNSTKNRKERTKFSTPSSLLLSGTFSKYSTFTEDIKSAVNFLLAILGMSAITRQHCQSNYCSSISFSTCISIVPVSKFIKVRSFSIDEPLIVACKRQISYQKL